MVSDVLSDAVTALEYCLKTGWYNGEIKKEIIAIKTKMNSLRVKLDTPPEEPKKKTTVGNIGKSNVNHFPAIRKKNKKIK
jgi:hypothetical protein